MIGDNMIKPTKEDLENLTNQELRTKYKISYADTAYLRTEAGIVKKKKSYDKPSSLTKEELQELSLVQLSAKYSIPMPYFIRWRKEFGVKIKQGGLSKIKCPIILDPKKYEPLFGLLTDAQIARAFEISRERVGQLKKIVLEAKIGGTDEQR